MQRSARSGSFTPRDVTYLRGTSGQRGTNAEASCDSTVRIPGTPLRNVAAPVTTTIARFYLESALCLCFIVGALAFVGWLAEGFREVPVQGVPVELESDDRVRSYE
jgi:hypothetical protein